MIMRSRTACRGRCRCATGRWYEMSDIAVVSPGASLRPARLRVPALLRLGGSGLRARPLRAVLSALGIAIGIAAMISVVGISSSSQADLDRALAALGTNMLTVTPGQTMFGKDATLPDDSVGMIRRIGPVLS